LRAIYGADVVKNALHGSTSAANAFREVKLFFPKTCPRELTVCLIKPDGLDSAAAVLAEAEAEGFLVVSQKRLTLSHEQAAQFLAGSVAPAELEAAAAHLSSGEVVAAAIERSLGVEHCLAMIARSSAKSALYGSANAAAAARDVAFLFGADFASKPETTFAFVKPDAYVHADAIVAVAEANGFTVLASQTVEMSAAVAAEFYKEHSGREFFKGLVDFMSSGPALALVLMRPGAISAWRALLGPTDAAKAKTDAPLSLRANFGTNGQRNACHGSDSSASAAREAGLFFPFLAETQTTLGLALPHAVAAGHVDALLAAAAAANLVVTQRLVTQLDRGAAEDFVDLLGAGAPPKAPPAPAPEPFISAWMEGGKCNKFLQLYNPSDEVVDLSGYATPMMGGKGARGGGMPTALNPLPPGKAIPPRGVFVIYHPDASAAIKEALPVDARHSMAFDGLSAGAAALALAKLHVFSNGHEPVLEEGAPLPFTVLDYVGDFSGANKGRPWPVAGTENGTKDHTIVRKARVGCGNAAEWTDPTASSQGSSPETSEWVVFKKDTIAVAELGWSATEWRAQPGPPPPPLAGSYEAMVEALSAGPLVAFALSGKGAIARWNALLGPSTPALAKVRRPQLKPKPYPNPSPNPNQGALPRLPNPNPNPIPNPIPNPNAHPNPHPIPNPNPGALPRLPARALRRGRERARGAREHQRGRLLQGAQVLLPQGDRRPAAQLQAGQGVRGRDPHPHAHRRPGRAVQGQAGGAGRVARQLARRQQPQHAADMKRRAGRNAGRGGGGWRGLAGGKGRTAERRGTHS